jgi:hypothetical protein
MLIPIKKIVAAWTELPCEECGALANQGCSTSEGISTMPHASRVEAHCQQIGEKMPPMGVWAGVDSKRKA